MPNEATPRDPLLSKNAIVVIAVLIGFGAVQQFYRFYQKAAPAAAERNAAMQTVNDIKIGQNLRTLRNALEAFSMSNPGQDPSYGDLVGPEKLIPKLENVAGEKYPVEFSLSVPIAAVLQDGTTVVYDEATLRSVHQGPKQKPDERMLNIRVEENICKLTNAQEKFLRAHPGKTARYSDLVGPGKVIPKLVPADDEKYPNLYPPGEEVVATLPNGVLLTYGYVTYAHGSGPGIVRIDPKVPPAEDPSQALPTLDPKAEKFANLHYTIQERELQKYAKLEAPAMLEAMLIENDPVKQSGLTGLFIRRLTAAKKPSKAFLTRLQAFLEDDSKPQAQRDLIMRALRGACISDVGSIRYLMRIATTSPNPRLRDAATQALAEPFEHRGVYEYVWCESNDEKLLTAMSLPMAQLAGESYAELLMKSAFDLPEPQSAKPAPEDLVHAAVARRAIPEMTAPEFAPLLLAQLAKKTASPEDAKLLLSTLYRTGVEEAGKALVDWLQKADEDATPFIKTLDPSPRSPELKAAFTAALDRSVTFRNELNREIIRTHLAPPPISNRLANGSFEDGTFNGFTHQGACRIIKQWSKVTPTDGQYMVYLDTMENAIDGVSTLTTERFEVPAGMKALLFEYYFAASALLHPVNQALECYIITDTETFRCDTFANVENVNCHQGIDGYDEGTGFRTASITLQHWAGKDTRIRIKLVIHGRGELPEHIPGMNQFDANVLGHNTSGTALFVDNFRLTPNETSELPPLQPKDVSIKSDGKQITITATPGAIPRGSTLHILAITLGDKEYLLNVGPNNKAVIQLPTEYDNGSDAFLMSYTTAPNPEGPLFSPQILLQFEHR